MFRLPAPSLLPCLLPLALALSAGSAGATDLGTRVQELEREVERIGRTSISPRVLDESVAAAVERLDAKSRADALARIAEARSQAEEEATLLIKRVDEALAENEDFKAKVGAASQGAVKATAEIREAVEEAKRQGDIESRLLIERVDGIAEANERLTERVEANAADARIAHDAASEIRAVVKAGEAALADLAARVEVIEAEPRTEDVVEGRVSGIEAQAKALAARVLELEQRPQPRLLDDGELTALAVGLKSLEERVKVTEAALPEAGSRQEIEGRIAEIGAGLKRLDARQVDGTKLVIDLDDVKVRLAKLESEGGQQTAAIPAPALEAVRDDLKRVESAAASAKDSVAEVEGRLAALEAAPKPASAAGVDQGPIRALTARVEGVEREATVGREVSDELRAQLGGVVEQLNANLLGMNEDLQAVASSQAALQGRTSEGYSVLAAQLTAMNERLARIEAILNIQ